MIRILMAVIIVLMMPSCNKLTKTKEVINKQPMSSKEIHFEKLLSFLELLPAIDLPAGRKSIGYGFNEDKTWYVKFQFNYKDKLAWRHIQELGHVLNYLSIDERLPTVFMPVSPPPYLNGGIEYLSWIIESNDPLFTPDKCAEWLNGRLPRPVSDRDKWKVK